MATIRDWPALTKVIELRSFLDLSNYYKQIIKGYSKVSCPLTELLKKARKWDWDKECQVVFHKLKDAITSEPVQRPPDLDFPFEVHTNASDMALRGVLVHEGHPIAFESRKFDMVKQRYSTHKKEMTAAIHCLKTLKHYLMGTRFTMVVDVANTFFKTQNKLTVKQDRWKEFLFDFDFV